MNGQNTLGVDVLKGVAQSDGFFDRLVSLAAHVFEFILQVCDLQIEFAFFGAHTQSFKSGAL